MVRPDTRDVVAKAIGGRSIEVRSIDDYLNLYSVFRRIQRKDNKLANYAVTRVKVGRSRWLVTIAADDAAIPEVQFDQGYDPKHGRYKRYATQLADGEVLTFTSEIEMRKAQRAWHLYVPKSQRTYLRSISEPGRKGRFELKIVQR
jgi:hypothetical protein